MKNKNTELSIKSKLLFNKLDTNYNIFLDMTLNNTKRIKAVDNIFSAYRLTVNPFISDETVEYQKKLKSKINEKQNKVHIFIEEQVTVETLIIVVLPILNQLKEMISTCKANMDKINALWGIE